ncbi:class I SAM-dependent methyltransferase [Salarchaeum sp. III]|uniref:class I SAM-dependent methyltransferase n=1 Tax=Salarchaeum sp. III TaxID=3107927 RepID=UPI002ED8DB84
MTDVRRGYDELADEYADARELSERERRILDGFFDGVPANSRVLDAGCGPGTVTRSAVGLDFSRKQLQLASERLSVVQGDLRQLPFSEETFDAVVASNAVIHVPVPDHETVFAEFARVLEPGGRLLVSESDIARERTNPDWLGEGREMTWHMAGADATRTTLREAGFEIEDEWLAPETEGAPEPPYLAARRQ